MRTERQESRGVVVSSSRTVSTPKNYDRGYSVGGKKFKVHDKFMKTKNILLTSVRRIRVLLIISVNTAWHKYCIY